MFDLVIKLPDLPVLPHEFTNCYALIDNSTIQILVNFTQTYLWVVLGRCTEKEITLVEHALGKRLIQKIKVFLRFSYSYGRSPTKMGI